MSRALTKRQINKYDRLSAREIERSIKDAEGEIVTNTTKIEELKEEDREDHRLDIMRLEVRIDDAKDEIDKYNQVLAYREKEENE